MKDERITIFAGHYGSGKTNIAVNYALELRKRYEKHKIAIADLDIVNPYFRTKDSVRLLAENSIHVITSDYANTNLDVPAMPGEAMSIFDDKTLYGVVDLGGDDRGAVAIGRYKSHIENEVSKNIILVVNCYRPLSRNAVEIISIKKEIEAAAGFRFNGIVNNSNLGADTSEADIIKSAEIIKEVAEICVLPVFMTCVDKRFLRILEGRIPNLFGLNLSIPQMLADAAIGVN